MNSNISITKRNNGRKTKACIKCLRFTFFSCLSQTNVVKICVPFTMASQCVLKEAHIIEMKIKNQGVTNCNKLVTANPELSVFIGSASS